MREGLHGRRGPLASCGLTSGGGGRSCGGVPVPRRQVAFPWGLLAAHLLQLHKRCAVRSPPIPAAASALVRGPVISIFFSVWAPTRATRRWKNTPTTKYRAVKGSLYGTALYNEQFLDSSG